MGDMQSSNGMLCPHAAGNPVPGEAAPVPGPVRAAARGPIAPATTSGPPAKTSPPAAKSGGTGQSQGAASQAKAQAQRPATASQGATTAVSVTNAASARATVAAPRHGGAAASRPPVQRPERTAAKPRSVHRSVTPHRPTVGLTRGVAAERPAASPAVATKSTERSNPSATLAALFGLLGLAGVAALVVLSRRRGIRDVRHAAPARSFAHDTDAAIEAELQAMIAAASASPAATATGLEPSNDDREPSATR
jgi:hypothetical protein